MKKIDLSSSEHFLKTKANFFLTNFSNFKANTTSKTNK